MNRCLVQGFNRFVFFVASQRRLAVKAHVVVCRLLYSTLQKCLLHWNRMGFRSMRLRIMVCRLQSRERLNCFDFWCENTEKIKSLRGKAKKIIRRLKSRELLDGWQRWCRNISEGKALRRKANKIIQRLKNRGMVQGWELLRKNMSHSKTLRHKAHHVVQRLKKRQMVQGWERWRLVVGRIPELMLTGKKVVQRLKHTRVFLAFERWCEYIAEGKDLHHKVSQVSFITMSDVFHFRTYASASWKFQTYACVLSSLMDSCSELIKDKTVVPEFNQHELWDIYSNNPHLFRHLYRMQIIRKHMTTVLICV